MVRTYTVHGHFKRRDGRQEALWTRTGLSKSAAAKLAKEQRAEPGGVAKIVPDEGPASPSRVHHATKKKSPAQLDREIAEALSRAPRRGGARHHATKADAHKIRYVQLAWSNPQSTSQRFIEGSYPETNVQEILEGLFQRGIPEVQVEDRDFALTSLDAVHAAAKHARDSVARRGRRTGATVKSGLNPDSLHTAVHDTNSKIAPTLGKTPAQLVRAINAIVRAADGRNVYLVSERLGNEFVRRVVGARAMPGTKGRGLDVRLLDTGVWHGVLSEMGDRIEVR